MEKQPGAEYDPQCRDYCCRSPKYRIEIEYVYSVWVWKVYLEDTDVLLKESTSVTRRSGLWFAKRWCKRYSKGRIKPSDDGSRTVYYDA
jgi:hypothetical protein